MKTNCLLKALLFLIFCFFCDLAFAKADPSQGLIAYYPFNGNANDASGNGNNGIPQNNIQLTSDRFGNANSAYLFDGIDDYIRVPNSSSLNPQTGLSVALYFNATQNLTQTLIGKISYSQGIGTEFQVGLGFAPYPGVFFGLNPPATGCSGQIPVNSSYVNNGSISLNQWHCMVSTFENGIQKLYVDGVLVQTVNTGFVTLNQCNNSDIQIGSWWSGDRQFFKGMIDDIRIYDRALTQDEVNSLCGVTQNAVPSFTTPDTVCVNTPVSITNTSVGASSYYWNFCVADLSAPPGAVNLGNISGVLSTPVFMDYIFYNGNYYGFLINYNPGGLVRLDFGNSLLNTPTAVNLGNFGGTLPTGQGTEGIQMIYNEGHWYAIIVGGYMPTGSTPRILKVDFGSDPTNPSPVATNWGNIGNMSQPLDLHVFNEGNNWYGFTVNAENNTITRFNFTNSFTNTPTAINLGNIGELSYPTGIYATNDNGFWRVFVLNAGNSDRVTGPFSLTRLDFGSSLLNNPVGVNLGNLGNLLQHPRDLTIMKTCGQIIGFAINGHPNYYGILKLDFHNNLGSVPTIASLGNLGSLNFPHSLSKLFRIDNDIYSFITNAYNNTVTRLKFTGCTNSSIPSSAQQNPPPVVYNAPGVYNINLTVDDGLPTQSAFCKQVVVLESPTHSPTQTLSVCAGGSIKIGSPVKSAKYLWSTSESTDSIIVNTAGTYWVESDRYGCSVRDSFIVTTNAVPETRVYNSDTTIYAGDVVQLNSFTSSDIYSWSPASNLNCTNCSHPIASPLVSTTYVLTGSDNCGDSKDSVRINVINRVTAPCYGFQSAIGTSSFDRGYDVVASVNDEFFVAGVTKANGNDDILVTKMELSGTLIWSKTFGGANAESVRKISATSDGGVLITGQSKSLGNNKGDILCLKVDNSGSLVWSRRFGVGSVNGDLGMDIIETTDGGYALSGILDVMGGVADAVVIKMDNNANVVWTKRFNSSTGEDGVGIVQKGDTLIVAADIETVSGNYDFVITKLKMADGSFITAKKFAPASRGLFNPYICKNPAAPGYIISGHTIDLNSYANMQHTIITIDDNLNVVNTKLVSVNPVTNDFFTGLVPLPDGSFIGTASSQSNADGYVYRIAANNTVMYAKRFNGVLDRRLYRIATTGQDAIVLGGTIVNGQEDMFVTNFKTDGTLGFNCEVEDATISVQQPVYNAASFTWLTITDLSFAGSNIVLNNSFFNPTKTEICPRPLLDFGFKQDVCFPRTVQFTSNLSGVQSYLWNFGNGQTNNSSQTPSITYADYGTYTIKLNVVYSGGCTDSVAKFISVDNIYDNAIVSNNDTTICLGDSILIKTSGPIPGYCWKASNGIVPTSLNAYVKPVTPVTYILTAETTGPNLVNNSDFSLGNTGFISDYAYILPNSTEGQYWIAANATSWNSFMASCSDHTSGSGNMLLLNGSPNANARIWSQTFTVTPNTNYKFSAWLSSLSAVNPANLRLVINNADVANNISLTSSTCQWTQFYTNWNPGNATTATVSIINDNILRGGNDFALDDIFFGQVTTKTDSFTVNVTGLCDSVKITGTGKVCSPTDTLTYSIYKSPNCTQQYSMQIDNNFATVISQTPGSIKLLFKKDGTTSIKVAYANNCKIVVDSLDVSVKFSPTAIDFGPDVVTCRDTSFVLSPGDGFTSYTWQDGSGNSVFTVNSPGVYNVVAQNLCGTQFKDTMRYIKSLVTPFSVSPLNATVCSGDSVQFKAAGGNLYAWSPASNFESSSSASTKALVNSTQNFSVFISDPVCNRDTTFTIPVTALPGANISVAKSNNVNCSNDSAVLIANGGISYIWSPNLFIARNNGNKITVKPYESTTYVVRGRDELGCYGQDSVTVYFFKEGNQKLFMPTAFTPNGDGKNELFRPTFIGPAAKYDFKIYNRWGQLVYESRIPGTGWDGTVKGIPQKADVYVFYIAAEGGCNGQFVQKGTFVLIR